MGDDLGDAVLLLLYLFTKVGSAPRGTREMLLCGTTGQVETIQARGGPGPGRVRGYFNTNTLPRAKGMLSKLATCLIRTNCHAGI